MKIRILTEQIVNGIDSEESLLDSNIAESLHAIRQLKVAALIGGTVVDINQQNSHGQVFIDEHDIWINKECYEIVT